MIFTYTILLSVLIISLAVWALYYGLTVRKYVVNTGKLKNSIRIVQISDLHSIWHGQNQNSLMKKIYEQNPDIVVLTGDLFDHAKNDDAAISFLEQINKYPCFFATGNHEYRSGDFENKINTVKKHSVHVLINESIEYASDGGTIVISGADDPQKKIYYDERFDYENSLEKAFSNLDTGKLNILLAHNNSCIGEYKKYPFDLVLSGHAHGGQFRVPFLINGFYVRRQGFFPKYAGGMYKHGKLTHIVSRGVSLNPAWCPRIFNPTELVVIDIS